MNSSMTKDDISRNTEENPRTPIFEKPIVIDRKKKETMVAYMTERGFKNWVSMMRKMGFTVIIID